MLSVDKLDLSQEFNKEDQALRTRRTRVACLLTIVFMPMGSSIDYLVYPDWLLEFLGIRILCTAFSYGLFVLNNTKWGSRHAVALSQVWAISLVSSFGLMILLTEGSVSPYYATINIAILTATVIMPWKLKEAIFMSVAALAIYILACLLHRGTAGLVENWAVFTTNAYFVFVTGAIGCSSTFFTYKSRISDFELRKELDMRNRELEDIDSMKSQFFANVSHELRTPLTLILAPIQDLLRRPELLTDSVSSLLRTARDNSLRLLKLVNDLLEVIKLEEGKTELQLQPVGLNVFLGGIVDSMSYMADPHNVVLHKKIVSETVLIEADTYALERVFLNLLSNAIKFTPQGGEIEVRCMLEGNTVKIEIADTGIGIGRDELPYIFERFRQADGSSTRKHQGSGLGLALVKDLTEKMNGTVTASSEKGVGTTMCLRFPVVVRDPSVEATQMTVSRTGFLDDIHQSAEHRAALPVSNPFEKSEAELTKGEGPVLMIVDDEPDMRQYLLSFLEADYRVSLSRDGRQALELARKLKPDLMLLDLMLPEIDGHEVCRMLKEDPDTRSIKIVLLTARVDEAAKITALENGADDFLTKPFSRTEIETRLRNLLETSKLESEIRDRNQALETAMSELKTTQATLVQSEKLNALGSLSAGLLHEVNNPLNYVIAALQMFSIEDEVANNEELQDYLKDINEGVERIRHIVTDLRTFAHPSELDKRTAFSIASVVDSARRFTSHDSENVDIVLELNGNDSVIGSQGHIIQILVNLINNAIKACEASDRDVRGEVRIVSENQGDRVLLMVKDNGIGMDEVTLTKVFDPFFTTRDVGDGMGLGLSICHTIMKNHGGQIKVSSELGVGTVFTLDLPTKLENHDLSESEYLSN